MGRGAWGLCLEEFRGSGPWELGKGELGWSLMLAVSRWAMHADGLVRRQERKESESTLEFSV